MIKFHLLNMAKRHHQYNSLQLQLKNLTLNLIIMRSLINISDKPIFILINKFLIHYLILLNIINNSCQGWLL